MNISKELQEKINVLLKNNKELRERLLAGDDNAIREIGLISQKGMKPKEIIAAYESKKTKEIYEKAKFLVELQEVYKALCLAYCEKSNISVKEEK